MLEKNYLIITKLSLYFTRISLKIFVKFSQELKILKKIIQCNSQIPIKMNPIIIDSLINKIIKPLDNIAKL